MKSCTSFLVRHWLIDDEPESERQFFDIEHITSGEHFRVTSFLEAEALMLASRRNRPSDDETAAESLSVGG
jgi:hypothetical protein